MFHTKSGLDVKALKGKDRALADALVEAVEEEGEGAINFYIFSATLELAESGWGGTKIIIS